MFFQSNDILKRTHVIRWFEGCKSRKSNTKDLADRFYISRMDASDNFGSIDPERTLLLLYNPDLALGRY